MEVCPICNGLTSVTQTCPNCLGELEDCGKLVDYLDDYSPYMDQKLLEQIDGLPYEESKTYCLHVLCCTQCHQEIQRKISMI